MNSSVYFLQLFILQISLFSPFSDCLTKTELLLSKSRDRKNMKKRDFIATNTFQSPSARKIFFDRMKDRKKNSEWWGGESAEIKERFCLH